MTDTKTKEAHLAEAAEEVKIAFRLLTRADDAFAIRNAEIRLEGAESRLRALKYQYMLETWFSFIEDTNRDHRELRERIEKLERKVDSLESGSEE